MYVKWHRHLGSGGSDIAVVMVGGTSVLVYTRLLLWAHDLFVRAKQRRVIMPPIHPGLWKIVKITYWMLLLAIVGQVAFWGYVHSERSVSIPATLAIVLYAPLCARAIYKYLRDE